MLELYQKEKIKAIGVSNYTVQQMEAFKNYSPINTSQPPYNLFERDIEKEILPYCIHNNITTLVYGPLCRGLLTGKMRKDSEFKGDDLRKLDPKFRQPRYEQYLKAVTLLDEYAQKNWGKNVIHLAIRWLLDRPGINIVLWGARQPNQLYPVPDTMEWELDVSSMMAIDEILKKTITDPIGPEFMAPPTDE
jgi:aryl-alcohol dehydrogenase-like predicted oxidoreductase